MADKGKQNVPGPHHNRFAGGLNPLVIEGVIKKELLAQDKFSETWGELIPKEYGVLPRSTEEAIAVKKQQLEELKSKSGGAIGNTQTITSAYDVIDETARMRVQGRDPEGHLKSAYKIMRGGV